MAPEVAEVIEAVKSCPHSERADLAYQVLRKLEEAVVDQAEVEATWEAEIHRRVDGYRARNIELIDLD